MRWLRGVAREPLLARAVIWVATAAAMLLAVPVSAAFLVVPLLIAVLPAAFPRTVLPALAMLVTAVIWLLHDRVPGDLPAACRLCALALALYYLHTAAALAAVLPYDGNYPPGVFTPALRRAGVVTVLTVAIGTIVTSMRIVSGSHQRGIGVWIGELVTGLGLVAGAAVFLIYLGKRAPLD